MAGVFAHATSAALVFYCHTLVANRTAVNLLTVSGWWLPGNDWWEPTVFGQPSPLPNLSLPDFNDARHFCGPDVSNKNRLINHTNAVGLVFLFGINLAVT